MRCPDCAAEREHIIRNADELYVPPEMRPAGLFAWVTRCWECGRNESGYTQLRWRDVTERDTDLLFTWRNDENTRRNSFSSEAIDPEDHAAWMARLLTAPAFSLLWQMALIHNEPVGVLRVHLLTLTPEINIMVAPQWQGIGIGAAMLASACIPTGTLGRVKGANQASRIAFERAGWTAREIQYVK